MTESRSGQLSWHRSGPYTSQDMVLDHSSYTMVVAAIVPIKKNNAQVRNGVRSEKSELKRKENVFSYISRLEADGEIIDFGEQQIKMVFGAVWGVFDDHSETTLGSITLFEAVIERNSEWVFQLGVRSELVLTRLFKFGVRDIGEGE
jgi:hypothetical protein